MFFSFLQNRRYCPWCPFFHFRHNLVATVEALILMDAALVKMSNRMVVQDDIRILQSHILFYLLRGSTEPQHGRTCVRDAWWGHEKMGQ